MSKYNFWLIAFFFYGLFQFLTFFLLLKGKLIFEMLLAQWVSVIGRRTALRTGSESGAVCAFCRVEFSCARSSCLELTFVRNNDLSFSLPSL